MKACHGENRGTLHKQCQCLTGPSRMYLSVCGTDSKVLSPVNHQWAQSVSYHTVDKEPQSQSDWTEIQRGST